MAPAMGQQVGIKGDMIPISACHLNNTVCGWEGRCSVSKTQHPPACAAPQG